MMLLYARQTILMRVFKNMVNYKSSSRLSAIFLVPFFNRITFKKRSAEFFSE
jgi:hypothetical protein